MPPNSQRSWFSLLEQRRELRAHKPAVRALSARVADEPPGLRAALIQSIALRRTA